MIRKKYWLMDNATIDEFNRYRIQKYRATGIKNEIDDDPLTQYYCYIIVHFLRKRKLSKDEPWKLEKFVHTAVCLFKRFYLANQYGDGEQAQNILCCIYLSLKINEVPNQNIAVYAKAWKHSKQETIFTQDCVHFGEPLYSQKQLHLLRGIGFQIGRSPLINSIQSLHFRINVKIRQKITENQKNSEIANQLQRRTLETIRRIYTNQRVLFLYEGPKIALTVVIHSIKEMKLIENENMTLSEILGTEIAELIQRNENQINSIMSVISGLKKLEMDTNLKIQLKELTEKLIKTKKKTFQIPQKKSPRITPRSFDFNE